MDTVEIIKAVVFGVVQGVTEWLPITVSPIHRPVPV